MAKWLIDAGHGGSDPGACYKGRRECDDTLRLAKAVGSILIANGESVAYTRTTDKTVELKARSAMERAGSYDRFVSIHRNAVAPEKAKGVETFVCRGATRSRNLAKNVNDNLAALGFYNRGVKEANYLVLRETKSPSILIEVGFIDRTSDNEMFDAKFNAIAEGIAKGCLKEVGKTISTTEKAPSNSVPNSKEIYRVRKSWDDASSQIGAFSDLNNAKAACDKNPGHFVYDSKGNQVYPIPEKPCDKIIKGPYNESATAKITTTSGIKFRDKHCTDCGEVKGVYEYNESVKYDKKCITEKYVWISWVSTSTNERRWMPIENRATGKKWAVCE